uniref:Type II/III secretion system secretin-like domain-containing protein n=1 Tax=Magnetococcus massalia (strain MO-1) TaxID=451514 RepID=A0A1S7LDY4_MAGMO|nr:Conserved outer membrane protein of unknown function. Containing conserved C-terminal domain with Type II secretion system protein [Candidatus Magnetococcus massalia]
MIKRSRKLAAVAVMALTLAGCQSVPTSPLTSLSQMPKHTALLEMLKQSEGRVTSESRQLAMDGVKLLANHKLESANEAFNKALKLDPRSAPVHYLNAMAYHLRGVKGDTKALDLAQQGYQLALKFDPTMVSAHRMLGELHADKGEHKVAIHHFGQAIEMDDQDRDLLWSMARSAYKVGKPDIAAAMVERLDKLKAITTPREKGNASIILAAVGEEKRANALYTTLQEEDQAKSSWRKRLEQRLQRWQDWYHREQKVSKERLKRVDYLPLEGIQKAQFDGGGFGGDGGGGGGGGGFGGGGGGGGGGGMEPGLPGKSVVVDVVIIRSEETLNTSKGVNLLSGLQLQFGDSNNSVNAWGQSTTREQSLDFFDSLNDTSQRTRTITRAINIPAITYTLNIANANNQRNEILARPTIIASSDQTSQFFSGTELNAAAVATGAQGGESISIEKQIGVKLDVTPRFMEDGRIQLQVYAERTFLKTPSSDVNFTFRVETSKTTVNANVIMRYGETVILSGLSEKEAENARDGVPFLQDLPLLQYGFSRQTGKEFQKSVLILLTPRPTQYVYQPEKARKEVAKNLSSEERVIESLRARYADWFKPYPNWASVFHHMQQNSLYREFRTGDVELEHWSNMSSMEARLKHAAEYLWF